MVSEKDFLKFFIHCKSMGANDPGDGQFGPKGHDWQDLCRGPLSIAIYEIHKLWAF